MIVGFNLKSEESRHRCVIVETNDYKEALATVKSHFGSRIVVRAFALIIGGKK